MRIRCFAVDENPAVDFATELVSKSYAAKLLKRGTHRRIDHKTIQAVIKVKIYREPKQYGSRVAVIPELLPIRPPDWAFTAYPLPDQRTVYL